MGGGASTADEPLEPLEAVIRLRIDSSAGCVSHLHPSKDPDHRARPLSRPHQPTTFRRARSRQRRGARLTTAPGSKGHHAEPRDMAPHRLRPPRAGPDAHLSTRHSERATSLVARHSATQHSTRSAKRCDGAHAHTEHTQCALSQCRALEAPHAPVANGSSGSREQLIDRDESPHVAPMPRPAYPPPKVLRS